MAYSIESTVLHTARKRLVKDYPEQIRTCLDQLSDEEIWWRGNESSNAVGNLILHLCGSNRYYLVSGIAARDFVRDRDREFAERMRLTRSDVRQRYDAMVAECDEILGSLTDADMTNETDRTGKAGTTFAQILLHVTHHNAVHLGQIVFATKLLKEGAIHELWRRVSQ
jgi:uncharacterized damage-inducible protein DinB